MIPNKLKIQGFLSYRGPVEIDLRPLHLAAIVGHNGAGKSSLLEAITWALYGQARASGDEIINRASTAARVEIEFDARGQTYKVVRTKKANTPTSVDAFVHTDGGGWKAITEKKGRETTDQIAQIIGLDYEIFVNASFFLQGKADQFTQQRPGDRKRILASILGLDQWEAYRERAAARRIHLTGELERGRALIKEYKEEADALERYKQAAEAARAALEQLRLSEAKGREAVAQMQRQADAARAAKEKIARRSMLAQKLARIEAQLAEAHQTIAMTEKIRADEQAVQAARDTRERLNQLRARHAALRAQADQVASLLEQESRVTEKRSRLAEMELEEESAKKSLADVLAQVDAFGDIADRIQRLTEENARLKAEMAQVKGIIDDLEKSDAATCVCCGQPISAEHKASRLAAMQAEGRAMGDTYRANAAELENARKELATAQELQKRADALNARLQAINAGAEPLWRDVLAWGGNGKKRLAELPQDAAQQADAIAAEIASIEAALPQLDEASIRQQVAALTAAEAVDASLSEQRAAVQEELDALGAVEEVPFDPDALAEAERDLTDIEERVAAASVQLGGCQQQIAAAEDAGRKAEQQAGANAAIEAEIALAKGAEKAFSRQGVPALLIEQALPLMQARANALLDQLSEGRMSMRFVTQAEYKDKKRDDFKETLDIIVGDESGERPYEMYSGGEAFRINFAIRLALAETLAHRAGASVKTLVIDEGFGSQDPQGVQRLLQAINAVKGDFAKILIITHLDEMRDAFPARIEIEKTVDGTRLSVVQ